jgi:PAS domain S-box-containing protein
LPNYGIEILKSPDIWKYVFDALPDLIAILDRNHKVVKINKAMAKRLGVAPDQGVGLHCYEVVHQTDAPILGCPHSKLLQDGLEHTSEVQEDNIGGYFLVTASPIRNSEGEVLGSVHIARDITERRKMEEKLQKTLDDKDVLLKEIHHRVKNNLMMISSLLNIQSRYIKDHDVKEMFLESRNRAKSMAFIHQKLYQTGDMNNIEFSEYLRNLATEIMHSYTSKNARIELKLDLEPNTIDVDRAIPLGLISTELIINCFKHAFPEGTGEISVKFNKEDGLLNLIIKDDGIGFPEGYDFRTQGNMGMNLVNALTDQIDGSIDMKRENGTKFILQFNDENRED